jgi:restriction system protein
MAEIDQIFKRLREIEMMRKAGMELPRSYLERYIEYARARGITGTSLYDEYPLVSEQMLEALGPTTPRPTATNEKPKRRPTGRPLIAIGQDRRIAIPTEALAAYRRRSNPSINVTAIIVPDKKIAEGTLIVGTTVAWARIAETLKGNWSKAFEIPPEKWEEIIAGAFERAGYDQVILTPRSGDFGRDVIAIKNGIGCIKIIGSVKAYAPGNLVKQDDVRALLGVLSGESDASKGIITTTSDFAPRIVSDPFIKRFLPTRLELLNGDKLQQWLSHLVEKPRHR